MKSALSLAALACLATACSSDSTASTEIAEPKVEFGLATTSVHASIDVDATLRSIAAEYASWHRVDEWNHWAPTLCKFRPSVGRISASTDTDTHGRKLYYLYAKDRAAYIASKDEDQPVGQVIVKESWKPVEVGASDVVDTRDKTIDGHAIAERDGKRWKPGERNGLFVMIKRPSDEPGTDAGWIYATVSVDGSVVHESGRVASCMGCHDDGTRDRMFGLNRE